MEDVAAAGERRHSRFWLYTPFVLLFLLAIAWSIAWFVVRNRATASLDTWLASEARGGREWTCADREVGGYPFRIMLTCGALTLKQGPVTASLGRVTSVSQVYQPAFVITQIDGPLQVSDGQATLEGSWDLLQSSIHASSRGLQRFSLIADAPRFTLTGLGADPVVSNSRHLELHVRPSPSRSAEKAFDAAISLKEAQIPALDRLVGGAEPADFTLDATVTQAEGIRGRPVAQELERWRSAGGLLDVVMLSIAKGPRRAEAKGAFALDERHLPTGQFTVSAAGLDGLIGNLTGGRIGGSLLGALFGQSPRGGAQAAQPALVPLPPLRLENGKLAMGPFVVPGIRLQPLY
ncbi:DUF2125 domain-containing protein [Microvirga antarctica]|uniref:DUF2125 domain-containing protein n=1 Tax=Microvirga antarctica TaxID=2819233 RepID=UPI001B303C12|nr:DUF2125 domain-containing protein [Microvirga antarctica]